MNIIILETVGVKNIEGKKIYNPTWNREDEQKSWDMQLKKKDQQQDLVTLLYEQKELTFAIICENWSIWI